MRVGLVSLHAAPLFLPDEGGRFGGAEWRAATFARGLARLTPHEVVVLVGSDRPRPSTSVDGLEIVFDPTFATRRRKLPWLRWPRWRSSLLYEIPRAGWRRLRFGGGAWRAALGHYARLNLDAVVCFGVNEVSATVFRSLAGTSTRRLLFLASDGDLDEAFATGAGAAPYGVPGQLGQHVLRDADAIAVQRVGQQEVLGARFGRAATVIRNPIDLGTFPEPLPPGEREHVLWVGRADLDVKRPRKFFELAARFPDEAFLAVMNAERRRTWEELVGEAPANVRVVEHVPAAAMNEVFRRAKALVNTSAFEGFPNTFLQAAALDVPILSLDVDPDGFLEQDGAGVLAGGSLDRLAEHLMDALDDTPTSRQRRERARRLIEARHDLPGRVRELERLLHVPEAADPGL